MRYAAPLLLPVDAPIRRARIRLRQRGFTLIELAIALAVVGLLLGASIIPLRALDEARQLRDEQRRLEVVRDAIVGYALRHRTRARTVKFVFYGRANIVSESHVVTREFRLPGGRPYLPCPDWDGDGFEDRTPEGAGGFVQGMEVKPDLTVTATLRVEPVVSPEYFLHWSTSNFERARPYGECSAARGTVPWRTLGIPPSDSWGNRHTYFADPMFSNVVFGFDRQTIADIYEPRIPEVPGVVTFTPRNQLLPEWTLVPAQRFLGGFDAFSINRLLDYACPAAVCDGGRSGNCAAHRQTPSNYYPPSASIHQCSWTNSDTLALKAGVTAREEIDDGRKRYPAGSVIDGLPFVLVSHGSNGRFAVKHWASLRRPVDSFGAPAPVCNLSWAESMPGFFPRYAVRLEERALAHEAINGTRLSPNYESCPPVHRWHDNPGVSSPYFNLSFFVWEPSTLGDNSDFDDLLLWMTREELSLAVPGKIPPLPRMMLAYFP